MLFQSFLILLIDLCLMHLHDFEDKSAEGVGWEGGVIVFMPLSFLLEIRGIMFEIITTFSTIFFE